MSKLSTEELARLVEESKKSTDKEKTENFFKFFKTNKQILMPCVS